MRQAWQLGGQDHQQTDAIENTLSPQPIQDMTPPTTGPRTQPHLQVEAAGDPAEPRGTEEAQDVPAV